MKILIIHFRSAPPPTFKKLDTPASDSAGTDGVSLEIQKRSALLKELGHQVSICSAYSWSDFPIPELEFDSEEVRRIMKDLFGPAGTSDYPGESELRTAVQALVRELESKLGRVVGGFAPELIFIHNVLSLPVHPAATIALTGLLEKAEIPCAAVHHDVLSEGAYKFTPTCPYAQQLLDDYFPPRLPNLSHWVINSRNRRILEKKNVVAQVIHDTMDFNHQLPQEERKALREKLRQLYGIQTADIVLFVGCRLVSNKQVELAGYLTAWLQKLSEELIGRRLYNEETFTEDNSFVLVLAGRPERTFAAYRDRVFALFESLGIRYFYVGDRVRSVRSEELGLYALYPDMYTMADFVLYPTGWEGFGNQLLEAMAVKLPAAVFEYPVFKEDIAPKGAKIVSLGDRTEDSEDASGLVRLDEKVLVRAAGEIVELLGSAEEYEKIVDHNFEVGQKYFSFSVLQKHLKEEIQRALQVG
jgi:glycosyltransferase involved in cell wall biosynthesis